MYESGCHFEVVAHIYILGSLTGIAGGDVYGTRTALQMPLLWLNQHGEEGKASHKTDGKSTNQVL
jgi:hypothetical protein